jgi:hypothetical protein
VIFISVALRLPVTNGRANVEPSVAMKIDGAKLLTRRDFLGGIAGTAICALTPIAALAALSRDDHAFLEDLSRRSFQFFWEHTDPDTGLTRGRARTDGSPYEDTRRDVGSIAVTGFGLAGLCIASERKWVKPEAARTRVGKTMQFFAEHAPREHGWFYHWMDVKTGERTGFRQTAEKKSELSSIDTALLMGGILTARQYFHKDAEIARLASQIYARIDFQWMLNGDPLVLCHGWNPEEGFLRGRWNRYSEHTIIYLLGIGSPRYAIKPKSWYAWERNQNSYAGFNYIGAAPLFTHQYSQAFIDYRHRRENAASRVNWFDNSVTATRAHRQFCVDLATEFPGYSENVWGITSSLSKTGYKAWGGPPRNKAIDGTVVPCAPAGSLMFTPDISLAALCSMKERYGEKIYGRYGFTDAFHPTNGWVSPDVLGLDVGITLLSAENLRTGNLWKWFMRNPEIPRAMKLAGLM